MRSCKKIVYPNTESSGKLFFYKYHTYSKHQEQTHKYFTQKEVKHMTIQDIVNNKARQSIFCIILEEACRQWCAFIDETPERKDGEGFAEFFFEIFLEKEEYLEQARSVDQ